MNSLGTTNTSGTVVDLAAGDRTAGDRTAGDRSAGGSRSGLEQLRWIKERGPAAVGVAGLLDMEMEDLGSGHVVFTARTRPDFGNPQGTLHGGITATLLDSAMACAVFSALPPGSTSTTLDLSVRYLRSAPLDGTRLWAVGDLVHRGRTVATAEARLVDDRDRLIATATTTCMVIASTGQAVA